jgi:hypothetical protein
MSGIHHQQRDHQATFHLQFYETAGLGRRLPLPLCLLALPGALVS